MWLAKQALAVLLVLGVLRPLSAYTPLSPEVKAAVEKAVPYLEAANTGDANIVGGKCLIAMAIYKAGAKYGNPNPNHPKVLEAVQAVRDGLQGKGQWDESGNYSTGIAIMFLCSLDADLYRREIDALLQRMLSHQRRDGGWGYHGRDTGDTSQTQYAVLALWSAKTHDIPIPEEAAANVCNWLMRTQTPGGLWAYQGKDPGHFNRIDQPDRVTPSMIVAGVGSVYMSADVLGFVQRNAKEDDGKPKALIKVEEKSDKPKASDLVSLNNLNRSLADGDRGFAASYNIRTNHWQMYYLYGLERYQSFKELARGGAQKEPGWYNEGVNFLLAAQRPTGSWIDSKGQEVSNTAFAARKTPFKNRLRAKDCSWAVTACRRT